MPLAAVGMNRKSSGISPIRLMVMGSRSVGKSAVTVRFLTRRFISEYSSLKDLLYRYTVLVDNRTCELEILDTSRNQENKFPEDKVGWADALVIVYSIDDRWSFEEASTCLQKAQQLCPCLPTILVANKRDLSHVRQVDVDYGRQLSLSVQCQFYEVSAADSYAGVHMAFQSILREVLATKILRSLTSVRRRLTVVTVSKMLGAAFGKNAKGHKKRPSLSL
ncbi:ras-related and estrogen-regulated growth inhibitor-like protein [Haemaphysalis longicornis]